MISAFSPSIPRNFSDGTKPTLRLADFVSDTRPIFSMSYNLGTLRSEYSEH